MGQPLVTVLMTVYNGEKYILEAIRSALMQTYTRLEVLVVVEYGTSNRTFSILKSIKDKRLRVILNETRLGISESLNRGLELAKGKYIARLDDDDISLPERISKQVKYMEKNPKVSMCGTNAWQIDDKGRITKPINLPRTNGTLQMLLYTGNYFLSSSVMFRRELVLQYELKYKGNVSEDYRLWTKIAEKGNVANLKERLTAYRIFEGNRSNQLILEQETVDREIQAFMWNKQKIDYPLQSSFGYRIRGERELKKREKMLKNLLQTKNFRELVEQDFMEVMIIVYAQANKNVNSAIERYWRIFGKQYGTDKYVRKIYYSLKHNAEELKRMLLEQGKIGKRVHIYEKF